jgi:hypothetical protein
MPQVKSAALLVSFVRLQVTIEAFPTSSSLKWRSLVFCLFEMSARSQPTPFFLVLFVPAPSLSCSAHSVKLVWAYDSNPRAFRVSHLTSLHLSLSDLDFILLFVFVSAPPLFSNFSLSEPPETEMLQRR